MRLALPSGRIFPLSFSAGVSKNRQGLVFLKKSSIYKKQNFSFSMKKRSGNRPVEEGDWRIERSLPENFLHGRPVENEVFL
jgi:hypothetical protein